MHSRLALSLILAGSLAVAACSGGPAAQPVRTGVFVDSPVAGLDYDSGSHAGKTTANGEFRYLDGETVVFRIGQLELGRSLGEPQLTPLQLAGSQNPADPKVLRQVQLLLTLDEDDNPNNGIQISADTAARFRRSMRLEQAGDLQTLLDSAGIARSVVAADYAASHFRLSLAALREQPPGPRFTALAEADGAPLTDAGERAGCVKDKQTGLIWEVKSVQGLRSQFHSYYASASRNPERPAQCEPGQEDCLAVTYTEAVSKQKLCGFEDSEEDIAAERGWRLPTERELKTLLDWSQYDRSRGLPAMDRHVFPDAEAAFYWTATSRRGEGSLAVAFDDTHRTLPSVSLSLGQPARLRLVRGPKLADDPNPEQNQTKPPAYIPVSADGQLAAPAQAACVDDNQHPDGWRDVILWQARPRPAGAASLNPALAALQQQRLCQQDNWRLPTVAEAIRWLQLQQDPDYPAANAAARVWARDAGGELYGLDRDGGKQSAARLAAEAEQPLLVALSIRPAKPPLPDSDGKAPDAAQLAQWRTSYSQYQPGAERQAAWPAPTLDASAQAGFRDLGLLPAAPFPADNPYSAAKVVLGDKLFRDPRLSRNNRIACISCHAPEHGWSDPRPVSQGHIGQLGGRNAMTLLNTAYVGALFWDGRAASLEEQAKGPVVNPLEMHQPLGQAVAKIAAAPEYAPLFAAAYGDSRVDLDRMAKAIATFERTLISQDSAFDRFLKGERAALNDQALWGLHLFRTKARCINCHNSPLLSDNQFHNTGLNYIGRDKEDLGRGGVTGLRADLGKFRTPTLRDLLYTGDYMHTGDMPLDEDGAGVIEFYNSGGNLVEAVGVEKYTLPKPSPLLKPLGLSAAEKQALHAFLQALSGPPRLQPASEAELFRR